MSTTPKKSSSGNYIPSNAREYDAFSRNVHKKVDENIKRWTHIPDSAYKEFQDAQNNFRDYQETFPAEPTRSQTTRRNELQKIATSNMRQFIKFYLRNPIVTNDELVSMGIPPIDTVKTQHTEVKALVKFSIIIKGTNNVIVDFQEAGSTSKAKPTGCNGLIKHIIKDTAPQSHEEFTHSTLATRTPHTLEFPNEFSGKRVWIVMCWQNARGILGRWTEMQTAIIP